MEFQELLPCANSGSSVKRADPAGTGPVYARVPRYSGTSPGRCLATLAALKVECRAMSDKHLTVLYQRPSTKLRFCMLLAVALELAAVMPILAQNQAEPDFFWHLVAQPRQK